MPGTGRGGDSGGYPTVHQAAELERLSKQLEDLRRASTRRGVTRPDGTGTGAGSRGRATSAEPGEPIGLDAARKARRPGSTSAASSAATRSTGGRPAMTATRERSRQRLADDGAAVLPFRRSAEAGVVDDDFGGFGEATPRRASASGRGRSLADREARKAASRAAAADAFAAQLEADPEEAARDLCLGWLAVRPHTRAELASKLRRKGVPAEAMGTVLDRYGEVGLIDDAAFADAWVASRHTGRGLAKRALAFELRARGIDGATVDAAVGQLESSDEEATARALVTRKLAGMGHVAPEARARRLMGMLARKGYPGGMAASVVREVIAGSGVDIPDPDDD